MPSTRTAAVEQSGASAIDIVARNRRGPLVMLDDGTGGRLFSAEATACRRLAWRARTWAI
jgi:hypothetical protein